MFKIRHGGTCSLRLRRRRTVNAIDPPSIPKLSRRHALGSADRLRPAHERVLKKDRARPGLRRRVRVAEEVDLIGAHRADGTGGCADLVGPDSRLEDQAPDQTSQPVGGRRQRQPLS